MQLNVMPWLTVAWALLLAALLPATARRCRACSRSCRWRRWSGTSPAARAWRGGDTRWLAATGGASSKRFPPDSTVFVYWGFEPITMWQYALWSRTWDWDGKVAIPPAPSPSEVQMDRHRRRRHPPSRLDGGAACAVAQARHRSRRSIAAIASSSPTSGRGAPIELAAISAPCRPPTAPSDLPHAARRLPRDRGVQRSDGRHLLRAAAPLSHARQSLRIDGALPARISAAGHAPPPECSSSVRERVK